MAEKLNSGSNQEEGSETTWTPRFVDALGSVRRASRDSRLVIFALLTLTLANGVILLNSWGRGWTKTRLAKVRHALVEDCREHGFADTTYRDSSHPWTTDYARDRNFINCAELNRQYESLEKLYNEEILTVRVPLVGMSVDANWFSILSSIGFVILLGSLVTTLDREKRSLEFANHEEIRKRARLENFFAPWAVLTIIWFPVSVAVAICVNDWVTVDRGRDVDLFISWVTSIVGTLGVGACVVFALRATYVLRALVLVREPMAIDGTGDAISRVRRDEGTH